MRDNSAVRRNLRLGGAGAGYFQVVWPLNRQPVPLPEDMAQWPTVDIFVPTYNEDLNVVKNTIYASQG